MPKGEAGEARSTEHSRSPACLGRQWASGASGERTQGPPGAWTCPQRPWENVPTSLEGFQTS